MTGESPGPATVSEAVADVLDSILDNGGHNQFVGAGEKTATVRELRAMVEAGHRPTAAAVEAYLRASGQTKDKGARRLRGWYEAILDGRYLQAEGRRI